MPFFGSERLVTAIVLPPSVAVGGDKEGQHVRNRSRPLTWGGVTSVLVIAAMVAAPAPSADAWSVGTAEATIAGQSPKATTSVTLITGDTVHLESQPNGRKVASFVPAKGREAVTFQQLEVDGDLYVYPVDTLPYVGTKQLDKGLFNVTALIEQEYDDANRTTLPLILRYRDGADAERASRSEGVDAVSDGHVLNSINAWAVKADKAIAQLFWESVDDDKARTASPRPTLEDGIAEIRLDRRVRAHLHQSVSQIGAPDPWAAGFDGTGVKVAVLDTGIDLNHPDFAGKIAASESFVPGEEVQDGFGHGSHVASIVGGTGQASNGQRKGVARGAASASSPPAQRGRTWAAALSTSTM